MSSQKSVTLRQVTEADDEFILSVYASTRAEELARVPWTQEQKDAFVRMQYTAQKRHYAAEYPRARHQVVLLDGAPAGRIYLDRGEETLHILDITLLPQHRNAGAGTLLLRQIMNEGAKTGKPVSIYVESFNPSLRLFQRLGFQKVREDRFQFLMKWTPKAE